MRTSFFRVGCLVFSIFVASGFVTKAQKPFYHAEKEDGKVVSRTTYVMGDFGYYVQESVSKYTYDEKGDFLKREVCVWNQKYDWNEKKGKYCPDYSESNWTPRFCILCHKNAISNWTTLKLLVWNNEKKEYVDVASQMFYQLNDSNRLDYLAFQKGNKYYERVKSIKYDRNLFANQ